MYPGFDADDMVKRGLFSSLMPFRRKSLRPPVPEPVRAPPARLPPPPPPQVVVHPIPVQEPVLQQQHFVPPVLERTQQDIFREIVNECAQLERSTTTTPFSELSGCTSPRTPLAPCPSPMIFSHQQPSPVASTLMYPHHQQQMYDSHMHYPLAPPPYVEEAFMQSGAQTFQQPPVMVAPDSQMPNAALLEQVVKMVVSAMRESSLSEGQKETPEEILRRKRNQNNEAAARYRKRQRAARERAEEELHILSKRNDDLKHTVDHMEHEIAQLKELVLHHNDRQQF